MGRCSSTDCGVGQDSRKITSLPKTKIVSVCASERVSVPGSVCVGR